MAARLTAKQRSLFALVRSRNGQTLTDDDILAATGWKRTAWRVYVTNGYYAPYLHPTSDGKYVARLEKHVSEDEFRRQVTQSKRDTTFAEPLAQALIKRSRDNMILALEVYNRPSLVNRLDAFAMLFTTAWEQLFKAELVEAEGEATIFRPRKQGRRRESISLQECVERVFPEARHPTRRNIECIAELRHSAAHLVMPEIQATFAQLFQAGVISYAQRVLEKTNEPLVPRHNIGIFAMAATHEGIDAAPLSRLYGDSIATEIQELAGMVEQEAQDLNDERFAIVVRHTLKYPGKGERPDISLTEATERIVTVPVEKAVDADRSHPMRTKELAAAVGARLEQKIIPHHIQAIAFKRGWKKSNNSFHHLRLNPDTHKFSDKCVDDIANAVANDPDFIAKACKSYTQHQAKVQRDKAKKQSSK